MAGSYPWHLFCSTELVPANTVGLQLHHSPCHYALDVPLGRSVPGKRDTNWLMLPDMALNAQRHLFIYLWLILVLGQTCCERTSLPLPFQDCSLSQGVESSSWEKANLTM